jgi:hypothetical protein
VWRAGRVIDAYLWRPVCQSIDGRFIGVSDSDWASICVWGDSRVLRPKDGAGASAIHKLGDCVDAAVVVLPKQRIAAFLSPGKGAGLDPALVKAQNFRTL